MLVFSQNGEQLSKPPSDLAWTASFAINRNIRSWNEFRMHKGDKARRKHAAKSLSTPVGAEEGEKADPKRTVLISWYAEVDRKRAECPAQVINTCAAIRMIFDLSHPPLDRRTDPSAGQVREQHTTEFCLRGQDQARHHHQIFSLIFFANFELCTHTQCSNFFFWSFESSLFCPSFLLLLPNVAAMHIHLGEWLSCFDAYHVSGGTSSRRQSWRPGTG